MYVNMYQFTHNFLRIFRDYSHLKRGLQAEITVIKSPGKQLNLPTNTLLHDYVLEQLAKWNDKVAVECIETKRSYTYTDLRQKSLALADFFKNALKLKEKTTIGVLLPNIPEYPIIVLGGLRAGLTITTINPACKGDEIKNHLVHSNSKALIALANMGQEIRNITESMRIPVVSIKLKENATLPCGTVNFFDIINSKTKTSEDVSSSGTRPDDVALLPYSSGTTGTPKGVQLTHRNLVSNLEQVAAEEFTNFIKDRDEVIPAFMPFFHLYGLLYILLHSLSLGAKLITFPKFTSESFVNSLRTYRPTFIPLVPPVAHLIMNNPHIKAVEDLSSVNVVLSCAAPLGAADIARFYDITKGRIHFIQAYGMTETGIVAIQTTLLNGGIKIGGNGFLVPNTEAKFIPLDNFTSQASLGPHQSGELLIKGPQVMKGYLNNLEATRETITEDGWLRTGDIGHYDEDGHIFITDRLKELIKVKGFQVAPAELECILRTHPSIEDAAVVGVAHLRSGEVPKAFVVLKKDTRIKPEEIQQYVASRAAKFKHLEGGVVFVDSIPKTPSGKILRKELRK